MYMYIISQMSSMSQSFNFKIIVFAMVWVIYAILAHLAVAKSSTGEL